MWATVRTAPCSRWPIILADRGRRPPNRKYADESGSTPTGGESQAAQPRGERGTHPPPAWGIGMTRTELHRPTVGDLLTAEDARNPQVR